MYWPEPNQPWRTAAVGGEFIQKWINIKLIVDWYTRTVGARQPVRIIVNSYICHLLSFLEENSYIEWPFGLKFAAYKHLIVK